jgi:hypothetical protein
MRSYRLQCAACRIRKERAAHQEPTPSDATVHSSHKTRREQGAPTGPIYLARDTRRGFRGAGARHTTLVSIGTATGSRSVNQNRMICMRPFPRVEWGVTRSSSPSARAAFQDLADMGSRSVTGHCDRRGRDAMVILRGTRLGDVYEAPMVAKLDRSRVANGHRDVVSRRLD